MNRRKYLLSTLGLGAGLGIASQYNTQPTLATNIDLTNSITIPETQVEEDLNIKIEFEEFEIKPVNFYGEEKEITIRARTVVSNEYGSTSEWNTDIEPVTVKDELVSISEDKLIIPLEVNNAEYNDAFTLEVEFEFIGPERTLHTISENISISIGEGFTEAPDDLETIWEEMDTNEDGAKIITNVYELQAMNQDLSHSYVLNNDINATGTEQWNNGRGFKPIGDNDNRFISSLDGKEYEIIGLTINRPEENYVGLFGGTNDSMIKNTGLENNHVIGHKYVGGLTGDNGGHIYNSYSTGDITGDDEYIGGLVGINNNIIEESYSSGTVNGGKERHGGLVGENFKSDIIKSYSTGDVIPSDDSRNIGGLIGRDLEGNVIDSYATGDVITNESSDIGGLIGYARFSSGQIYNSYATGDVTGDNSRNIGGLIGDTDRSVKNCYSTGDVRGKSRLGGLIGTSTGSIEKCYSWGDITGDDEYIGGLVGIQFRNGDIVSNSYAIGNITGGNIVGGLIGWNRTYVTDSYALGNVNGNDKVGGLIGHHDNGSFSNGELYNSYSIGFVDGNQNIGGLIGDNTEEAIVEKSYWDIESSDQTSSDGGTELNTDEMQGPDYNSGFESDIVDNEAFIGQENDYPILQWDE